MTNANVFDQRIFQNIFAMFSLWKYRKKLKNQLVLQMYCGLIKPHLKEATGPVNGCFLTVVVFLVDEI
jgi:hypothetical protein